MSRLTGKVKWYNIEKGIGFASILIKGEERDILLHFAEFVDENAKPKKGDEINFDLRNNGKMKAENIRIINNANSQTDKEQQLRQLLHNTIDVMTYEQCKILAERLSFSKEMYE